MHPSCVIPKGDLEELSNHDKEATSRHLELVSHVVPRKSDLESSERYLAILAHDMQVRKEATYRKIMNIHSELARLSEEVGVQTAPLKKEITRLESGLYDFNMGCSKLKRMVFALKVTSYNGEFISKVTDVALKIRESWMLGTYSYSVPFFTHQFGYRLCLRLYLNGTGSGKGTHLSFYFSVMKGEYDDTLSWPFQQRVTLMLLDQEKRKNIVGDFRPDPSWNNFQQPKERTNLGAGFPKFAPLSVLRDPRYVRNDILYLKVIVDKTGLDQS